MDTEDRQQMTTAGAASTNVLPFARSRTELSGLQPATKEEVTAHLTTCLTLCAPVGLTEDNRVEWLKIARATVRDLPLDLLKEGCQAARLEADHPAKIVPIIMKTVEGALQARRRMAMSDRIPPERRIEPHYVKPEEASEILAKVAPSFAGIGSKVPRAAPRMPTEADYRAMGIEPGAEA